MARDPAGTRPLLTRVVGGLLVAGGGGGGVHRCRLRSGTTAVYGDFLLLNSNAGYAMYSAQHPMHGTSFQEYAAAPLPEDLVGKGLNEAQWDKELMRRGIGFVLAEPGRYLLLSLSRVRDYFEFWPTADSSTLFNLGRVLSIGLFLPFMLAGIYLALSPQIIASSIVSLQSSCSCSWPSTASCTSSRGPCRATGCRWMRWRCRLRRWRSLS